MGESHRSSSVPAYLYPQHPSAIHSESRPSSYLGAVALPHQSPTSLSVQGRSPRFPQPQQSHPQLQLQTTFPHVLAAQPPTLLLLQPFLQLSGIDSPRHLHSPLTPILPTVIVSPHYQSPTAERDPTRTVVKKPSAKTVRQNTDGNKGSEHSVHGSAPAMTPNGVPTMGSKREESAPQHRAQRPSIVSQHSNSVPSTPLQVARQYESRSRSPSPNGGLGSHSPRSVSSEANGAMPTLRTGRPFRCKYETNAAFGRRRIPYTSSDLLEKAKDEPKRALEPHEDDKLSGDMRELYDRLQPSQENSDRRDRFVKKLQNILETEWPGNDFKVHVFGSSGNMLYTSESDVDVCIETPMVRLEEMHMLAEALDKHGMERVVCVPQAKVRIVKVWDPELKLACDMNVNNTLALKNTRMIKTYIQIDDRVRPLAMIIKFWTKQRILNDAALGGTISSYTWICMILNFLQTRDPPILPSLHNLRDMDKTTDKPSRSEYADDLEKLRGFGDGNKETLGQLLFHFFRLYGHEVDYEKYVISVRQGRLLTREEKHWHLAGLQKEARNRLCVEEPFNTERNLGNSADDFAWRGIHLEIRRAFDLLAEGQQLEKVCEQYEFPPEEKSNATFRKPQSQKPTLTSSTPTLRSGRGGSNHRGGRGGFNSKGQYGNGRRASSGTNYAQGRPPFLHSPPMSAIPGQEYFSRGQLHDQLYQQYQMLEMQSNSLRAQLAAQQRAQQAQQVQAAHMHAQAVAQAQAQNRAPNSTSGSPQKSPYVNGRSSPRLAELGIPNTLPQGFLYQYPGFFDPSQANAAISPDGSRTNPSSPSLTSSVPGLRRGVHRASNASDTSSIRSQSQPARAAPQQPVYAGYPPMLQFFDPATMAGYPIAHSTPEGQTLHSTSEPSQQQYSPLMNYPEPAAPPIAATPATTATATTASSTTTPEQGTPKESVSYYVAGEQVQPRPLQDYSVPQIPSFNELAASRRRRVSPEITQPLLNTALRRVSRSPSPLGGHVRSYSTSVAPSGVPDSQHLKDRIDSTRVSADNGPVIVNGSFPLPTREARPRSDILDALVTNDIQNPVALGIFANLQDQYQMNHADTRQQLVMEEMHRQKEPELMGAPIVNGSMKSHSSGEVNGLTRVPSESSQPFPSLPEGWMNYQSANVDNHNHNEEISPTSHIQAPQWRGLPYTNGLSALDTLNAPRAPPQEIKSAGLPLLSPVFETRTPSPTASRQPDAGKFVNGGKSQGKDNNHSSNRRASHTAAQSSAGKENSRNQQQQKGNGQTSDRSNKPNAGNNNANSWQQSRKKKNKTKNKSLEQKSAGEALPANAADRKGG